jgi:putative glycosyltransferase (TIGR04372 family)
MNVKKYSEIVRNRRSITNFEQYDKLVDYLISAGWAVVLQGTNEQPKFSPRKDFFDYSHCGFQSPTNDLFLYSGCDFAIVGKTGPELYALICDKPVLQLNYSELSQLVPFKKSRYFPKKIKYNNEQFLSWRDYIKNPIFFNVGAMSIFENDIQYLDLDEDEIILATEEFISLIKGPNEKWLQYSELQLEYLSMLHPAHLDAYSVKAIPCDVYLKKFNGELNEK